MPLSRRDKVLVDRAVRLAARLGPQVRRVQRTLHGGEHHREVVALEGLVGDDGDPFTVPRRRWLWALGCGLDELAERGWESAVPLFGEKLLGAEYTPNIEPKIDMIIKSLLKEEVLKRGKSDDGSRV